jgi:hypothetical protein
MATKKKLLQAAAGNAGGAGLDVDEVFSTYLYTGNGSTQTITNNVDLSGEGGLVWIKIRDGFNSPLGHHLYDTARGATKKLSSNNNDAESTVSTGLTAFNSNGFILGSNVGVNGSGTGDSYVSWTFRKAPKFFDVVTWTGDGTNNRKIPHNLGSEVGCYFVKQANDSRGWSAYHRGVNGGTNPEQYIMVPSGTDAQNNVTYWNDTAPTSTEFTINSSIPINESGGTFVAYLWAHNDGDGEFGPDADQDIIKCGSYTGTGATGNNVNLGFEPQWLMIKRTDSTGNWQIADVMRGMPNNGGAGAYQRLSANLSDAEVNRQEGPIPTSTGFVLNSTSTDTNGNGNTYIYIAIRRPTAVPTSATEVFGIDSASGTAPTPPLFTAGFPVDMYLFKTADTNSDWKAFDRVRGDQALLHPNTTDAESDTGDDTGQHQDLMTGIGTATYTNADQYQWMWKRAPKYFDVVAYTGNGTAGRTVSHNLGVAPEMMWVKNRTSGSDNWPVYHSGVGNGYLFLNTTGAYNSSVFAWNNTDPTAESFTVHSNSQVNGSGFTYIAYLFATLAGVSKVGSATHSGTTNVDCGFTSGARFVLLKRTDASGDWYFWDSVRGIVSGNDPYLLLNSTAVQVTNTDLIDPLSSGFTITSNFTAGDYIFYAIA